MITELRAQNFKSWKDTGALRFAPLTGFFGANSAGKSSILQVLLMLKQTVERPSDWNEPLYFGDENALIDLTGFDHVIHSHKRDLRLGISITWAARQKNSKIARKLPASFSFSTLIDEVNERLDVVDFCYTAGGRSWRLGRMARERRFKFSNFQTATGHSTGSVDATPFRCYGVVAPDEDLKSFMAYKAAFEDMFFRIRYLGPGRDHPRRQYRWEGDHPVSIGQHGEKAISALLSGRIQLLSIEKQILRWLQRLDLIDSYRLRPDFNQKGHYDVRVTKHKGGPEVRLMDAGFGVSQVLPALILCYYAPENSILILEQPEAHLHPNAQSELADVLIDVVKNRNLQIIFESHSERLLHRLTRRIAEKQFSANDTALHACQISEGVSEIEQLKVDKYGNISNWPQNLFGDDMSDLAAKAKAEMKRRKRTK